MTRRNGGRILGGAALAATVAVVASCTWPPTNPGRTTTTAAPATTTTATTAPGHNHGNPDRLNHEPSEDQQRAALQFVADTRQAVIDDGLTLEKIQGMHYINIGDGVHWIKPEHTRDEFQLDPHRIEAFVATGGRLRAVMYVMKKGTTMNDVPDIAGNWTIWHEHYLPYRSADPMNDDYHRLGGTNYRQSSPMLHVWLEPHPCGPFAGTNREEGSCLPELESRVPPVRRP
jgi:hypothetical protein